MRSVHAGLLVVPGRLHVGIPLLIGRDFNERDTSGAPHVTVINESTAKFYFAGQNPIGKHIRGPGPSTYDLEIVGVAKDARDHDLREPPPRRFYVSYFQPIDGITTANYEIRTAGNPAVIQAALRRAVHDQDTNLPVVSLRSVTELMDQMLVQERLITKLAVFFSGLALLLASIGIYGVMSYAVARRSKEIGIRMALGATRGRVISMVLRETVLVVILGIAVGLPLALVSTRVVASWLFGLKTYDPTTTTVSVLLILPQRFPELMPTLDYRISRRSPIPQRFISDLLSRAVRACMPL